MQFNSIWPIDRILSRASVDHEAMAMVEYFSITGTSPSYSSAVGKWERK